MVTVVNFRDSPVNVTVAEGLSTVVAVGEVELSGEAAKLGGHSAVVAARVPG